MRLDLFRRYLLATLIFAFVGIVTNADAANEKAVLIYGDSITWGYVPLDESAVPQRYPFEKRWPGVLQKELGSGYRVIEEGLNGRTAGVDEFSNALYPDVRKDFNLNGRPSLLPILRSHEPLSLVIIMLGTNDTRAYNKQSLDDIKDSIAHLIKIAKNGARIAAPKVLVIAPPPGQPGRNKAFNTTFEGSYALAAQLGSALKDVAQTAGVEFLDAAPIVGPLDTADGIHLDEAGNKKLAKAVAVKIKSIDLTAP